jgi:hypothetical protein
MAMNRHQRRSWSFFLFLGLIVAIGASLRLYNLSSQILLDDEWHSINEVADKTFLEVLTRFNPHDNSSPPLNLYLLALLKTCGVSELSIRLPAVVAGVLSLIIMPLLVRRIFDDRIALIFASIVAIAPFLIFYSRYGRAYGSVALLCFCALLLAHLWLNTGKPRYAVGFVLTGALAVYAHLLSIVPIAAPFAVAIGSKVIRRSAEISVSVKSIVGAALALLILVIALIWPALSQSGNLPWAKGHFAREGVLTAATLLSGTANLVLTLLFFILLTVGLIVLLKSKPPLGWLFFIAIAGSVALLVLSRPQGVHRGAVLLRYTIVAVPIGLLLVSVAFDFFLMRLPLTKGFKSWLGTAGVIALLVVFFVAGPLPAIYAGSNNFTNHSAYQGSYQRNWERSEAHSVYPDFSINREQVPVFYRWLATEPGIKAIIEYPFDICDYNDLFYYYQHFHGKQVFAGYSRETKAFGYSVAQQTDEGQFSVGLLNIDQILYRADPGKLGFRNLIDITNQDALVRSPASIIILHKYMIALKIMPTTMGTIALRWRPVQDFAARFRQVLGQPLYEDQQMICFRIKPNKDDG